MFKLTPILEFLDLIYFKIHHYFYSLLSFFGLVRKLTQPKVKRAVLVTGCSSGIGRFTALELVKNGWTVFATVRTLYDGESLLAECHPSSQKRLVIIQMDVSDPIAIKSSVAFIKRHNVELYAIVNNAAVPCVSPIELILPEQLKHVFDVNVFGPVELIRTLLPLLIKSKGRIINISSLASIFPPPFHGIYSATKAALDSISESISYELQDVVVSVVCPGAISTDIWKKGEKHAKKIVENDAVNVNRYQEFKSFAKNYEATGNLGTIKADNVYRCIEHALLSPYPQKKYLIGLDCISIYYLRMILPGFVQDCAMRVIANRWKKQK